VLDLADDVRRDLARLEDRDVAAGDREGQGAGLELAGAGISQFLLSGWPDEDEMEFFGREVLPLLASPPAPGESERSITPLRPGGRRSPARRPPASA